MADGPVAKRRRVGSNRGLAEPLPLLLSKELAKFEVFRSTPLNQIRAGVAVGMRTSSNDRQNILLFLGWLVSEKLLTTPTLSIFGTPRIAMAVQRFVERLVQQGRLYSSVAKYVGSFLVCARFVAAMRASSDHAAVHQLAALHKQCLQQARQQTAFTAGKTPAAYLDWEGVQRARCTAQKALAAYRGNGAAKRLALTRDVVLLTLLSHQPPDRVGVTRLLRMGHTLKRTGPVTFDLDLSDPGAHKTSAVFGASITSIPPSVSAWLAKWVELMDIPEGGYIFHVGNPTVPYAESAWTEVIKATFRRTSGVAMSPKDLRSSFIGFLKSGAHSDETLKAAAAAMRHSSKTQGSLAYDKKRCDRTTAAAVKVATEYAMAFRADPS